MRETNSLVKIVSTGIAIAGFTFMSGCSPGAPNIYEKAPGAVTYLLQAARICRDNDVHTVSFERKDPMGYTIPEVTNLQVIENRFNQKLMAEGFGKEYLECQKGHLLRSPQSGTW